MQQQQSQSPYVAEQAPPQDTQHLPLSAFRAREKQFQLHQVQQLRRSKGRVRGGKLAIKDTDFSGVLDLHTYISSSSSPPPPPPPPGVHLHSPSTALCRPPCTADLDGSDTPSLTPPLKTPLLQGPITAITFDAHPGLVYIPAALPGPLQLQLMVDALCTWPQPPARTNHTLQLGPLPNMWLAAQAGLRLAPRSPHPQQQQQQQHGVEQPYAQPHLSEQQQQSIVEQSFHDNPPCDSSNEQEQGQSQLQAGEVCEPHDHHHKQQQQQPGHHSSSHAAGASSPFPCWQEGGPGPPARQLLQKLRWVSLGPPYNWSRRAYEPELPHAPLPLVLQQAALLLVEVATAALAQQQQQQRQAEQQQEGPPLQQQADQQQQQEEGPPQQQGGAAAAAAAAEPPVGQHPPDAWLEGNSGSSPAGRPYQPDAALVNYYRAGDTLGGHKDDVERDMSQPIVSISLGCPAVFLMGGESREVDPTPLLLRSGDVLVLGGPARRCFHGVPRVLPELGLPQPVVQAASAAALQLAQQQQDVAQAGAAAQQPAHQQHAPSGPGGAPVAAGSAPAAAAGGTGVANVALSAARLAGTGVETTRTADGSSAAAGTQGSSARVEGGGAASDGSLASVVEYLSSARVNISIRTTR